MGIKLKGGINPDKFRSVKLYTKPKVPDIAWWFYAALTDANRLDALPTDATYNALGLGLSAWFDSYAGTNDVSRADDIPLTAIYTLGSGEGATSNGPVWFASFSNGTSNEVSRQDSTIPTATTYAAGDIAASPWYDSYSNTAANEVARQDSTIPTSTTYGTAGAMPADTAWWTSYANGTGNEALRQDSTIPTSAVQAA